MIHRGREDAIRLLILKTLCWADFPREDKWVLEERWVAVMRLEKSRARAERHFSKVAAELDLARHRFDSESKGVRLRAVLHSATV